MTGGTEENLLLWAVCALHITPGQFHRLPAGEKVLYRLIYDTVSKGGIHGA